jgi:lipopolysaccharide heptosyltransferase II
MQQINKILISRMRYIGDVVLTTPVIQAVRSTYPDAYIAYLAEKEAATLLEHNPALNEIIPFDFSRATIIEQPRVMWELRKRKFDVFIDLFCNPRTALLARASGAPMRIGKEVKGRGNLYTHRIKDDGKSKSAVQFHFQYVAPIGVAPNDSFPKIFLTEDEKRDARAYLKWQNIQTDRPIIGLHPGATWPAKRWQWDKFADLADSLRAKLDAQIIFTQGPNDVELVNQVSAKCVGRNLVLPLMKLRQLAAIISCCNAYIANDNGTMHISAAVGTKTIGIFGPGEEDIWFPYPESEGHIALRKDVTCHPCHLDFCNRTGDDFMECMNLLRIREVYDEVKKVLEM